MATITDINDIEVYNPSYDQIKYSTLSEIRKLSDVAATVVEKYIVQSILG